MQALPDLKLKALQA